MSKICHCPECDTINQDKKCVVCGYENLDYGESNIDNAQISLDNNLNQDSSQISYSVSENQQVKSMNPQKNTVFGIICNSCYSGSNNSPKCIF